MQVAQNERLMCHTFGSLGEIGSKRQVAISRLVGTPALTRPQVVLRHSKLPVLEFRFNSGGLGPALCVAHPFQLIRVKNVIQKRSVD